MTILRTIDRLSAEVFVFNFKFIAHIHSSVIKPHCFTEQSDDDDDDYGDNRAPPKGK